MNPLRLLYFLIPFVFGLGAQAQTPLQLGALGGFTSATQSPGEHARTGFNLAVVADYAVLPYASVSLETAYVQKGQTYDGELTEFGDSTVVVIDEGTFTIALDYASFVLAAKPFVSIGPAGASVYAVAGPRLDVLLIEKLAFSGPEESVRFSIDEHEGIVWGYDVGLGVRLGTLLPVPLLAEVRFSGDLSNAFDGATRPTTRNRAVQVRVGIDI